MHYGQIKAMRVSLQNEDTLNLNKIMVISVREKLFLKALRYYGVENGNVGALLITKENGKI